MTTMMQWWRHLSTDRCVWQEEGKTILQPHIKTKRVFFCLIRVSFLFLLLFRNKRKYWSDTTNRIRVDWPTPPTARLPACFWLADAVSCWPDCCIAVSQVNFCSLHSVFLIWNFVFNLFGFRQTLRNTSRLGWVSGKINVWIQMNTYVKLMEYARFYSLGVVPDPMWGQRSGMWYCVQIVKPSEENS